MVWSWFMELKLLTSNGGNTVCFLLSLLAVLAGYQISTGSNKFWRLRPFVWQGHDAQITMKIRSSIIFCYIPLILVLVLHQIQSDIDDFLKAFTWVVKIINVTCPLCGVQWCCRQEQLQLALLQPLGIFFN